MQVLNTICTKHCTKSCMKHELSCMILLHAWTHMFMHEPMLNLFSLHDSEGTCTFLDHNLVQNHKIMWFHALSCTFMQEVAGSCTYLENHARLAYPIDFCPIRTFIQSGPNDICSSQPWERRCCTPKRIRWWSRLRYSRRSSSCRRMGRWIPLVYESCDEVCAEAAKFMVSIEFYQHTVQLRPYRRSQVTAAAGVALILRTIWRYLGWLLFWDGTRANTKTFCSMLVLSIQTLYASADS